MTGTILPRILLITGAATWLVVSLVTWFEVDWGLKLAIWSGASILYLLSFIYNARARQVSLLALALQSSSVIAMAALFCNGYEGLLLVIVAVQLALYGRAPLGWAWIGVQTLALAVAIAVHWTLKPSLWLTPPYLGFQLLMFMAVWLFVEERRTSLQLSDTNEELLRVQGELAQKARIEERLRIAHDMHDVLGHHLTALSINLEVAAHEASGSARTTVRRAQSLARALMRDLKELVRNAGDEEPVDLQREMNQLAQDLLRPKLHIVCSPDLCIADARTSRTLFRVIQEIVTNAIRHGEAQNLWIQIARTADRVSLTARDDGRAHPEMVEGFGLSGMRRRLEELGGTLNAAPGASGGFEVRAEVPYPREKAA